VTSKDAEQRTQSEGHRFTRAEQRTQSEGHGFTRAEQRAFFRLSSFDRFAIEGRENKATDVPVLVPSAASRAGTPDRSLQLNCGL
jgi:hypothetical protein